MSDNVSTVFISKYFLQYMSLCILRAGWIIIHITNVGILQRHNFSSVSHEKQELIFRLNHTA
jgi:hypothetical protein